MIRQIATSVNGDDLTFSASGMARFEKCTLYGISDMGMSDSRKSLSNAEVSHYSDHGQTALSDWLLSLHLQRGHFLQRHLIVRRLRRRSSYTFPLRANEKDLNNSRLPSDMR
jgi:hypothetical protein